MSEALDPIGFVADELTFRGALVERGAADEALAVVPAASRPASACPR